VASFIRPHGLDRPATPVLVEALRELGASETAAAGPDTGDLAEALRPMLVAAPGQRRGRKPGSLRPRQPNPR
jgi:hypothetical protein